MVEIKIQVNGDTRIVAQPQTVADLIETLLIPEAGLIVNYNDQLFKDSFDTLHLQNGDCIEFIHFMGGGS